MTTCLERRSHTPEESWNGVEEDPCDRVIMGNERELDLLQGLLVLLGWNQYHFSPMKRQLYLLLQMTVGLVTDLELDRCPAHRDQRVASHLCCVSSNSLLIGQSKLPIHCRRTSAEIRALLGCFYLCSSWSTRRFLPASCSSL